MNSLTPTAQQAHHAAEAVSAPPTRPDAVAAALASLAAADARLAEARATDAAASRALTSVTAARDTALASPVPADATTLRRHRMALADATDAASAATAVAGHASVTRDQAEVAALRAEADRIAAAHAAAIQHLVEQAALIDRRFADLQSAIAGYDAARSALTTAAYAGHAHNLRIGTLTPGNTVLAATPAHMRPITRFDHVRLPGVEVGYIGEPTGDGSYLRSGVRSVAATIRALFNLPPAAGPGQ